MTQQEIFDLWARYMHRQDMSVDYDDTWTFTENLIKNSMMYSPVDLPALLESNPSLYLHGGMSYLAEIARDDSQIQLEMSRFNGDVDKHMMTRSIATPAVMKKVY